MPDAPFPPERDLDALARAYARCLSGPDGERVMAHLRAMTTERALGPDVSEAVLRDLEGQRRLVASMAAMAARGRRGPVSNPDPID